MMREEVSRRGLFSRGVAAVGAFAGTSFLGRFATRRATEQWTLPLPKKVAEPLSATRLTEVEALKLETAARQLDAWQTLAAIAISRGLEPKGLVAMEGVEGYTTEGSRAVGRIFKRSNENFSVPGAFLASRWGPDGSVDVDLISVQADESDNVFVHRSFVEDGKVKLDTINRSDTCDQCVCWHYHVPPHGYCPSPCNPDLPCVHGERHTNICNTCQTDMECYARCGIPCLAMPRPWNAVCAGACLAVCRSCGYFCCDYVGFHACVPPTDVSGPLPVA